VSTTFPTRYPVEFYYRKVNSSNQPVNIKELYEAYQIAPVIASGLVAGSQDAIELYIKCAADPVTGVLSGITNTGLLPGLEKRFGLISFSSNAPQEDGPTKGSVGTMPVPTKPP